VAPIICLCLISLLYSLYLFIAYEESGVHHAQEFENRFWTIFALFSSTALFFAADSPFAFGLERPGLGFLGVVLSGYVMHLWDRHVHRVSLTQPTNTLIRRGQHTSNSLTRLRDLGIPVEDQLRRIEECLGEIDQLLIPSTINNMLNHRFVLQKEREILSVFEECDARALNYLIGHVKLGLLFYKIKDHRNFNGKHRTELVNLLAVERLSILTVISRVIVLHSLQLMKLRANPRAEYWVRNILLNTHQDQLSELKTLTDAKGDYFCMTKLIYDDIRSESVRQDILRHLRKEAAVQQTHIQMGTGRSAAYANRTRRKVLSDVDDTLYCSGGMYPAGVDKSYPKKAVYPGVLAFYRELDLGTQGAEAWKDEHVGNLVFLSARPHLYKDISEKANFAKFEKLRSRREDGRERLHTMPSLLTGDLSSGGQFMFANDFEPLARKKFDNFRRFVSIYPEYQHVFVCDNGQGDVRAGEMMFDSFPYEFEALYVHVVQDLPSTHGYAPERWREKEFRPIFFRTYPEAALHAASRVPPLMRVNGLQRICSDTVQDFHDIKNWPTETMKALRRQELNQAIWRANQFLVWNNEDAVELIRADQRFSHNQKVRTPYGIGRIIGFDPEFDLYEIELDWRPLDIQVDEHNEEQKNATIRPKLPKIRSKRNVTPALETVQEEQGYASGEELEPLAAALVEANSTEISAEEINENAPAVIPTDVQCRTPAKQEVGQSSAEIPSKNEEDSSKKTPETSTSSEATVSSLPPPSPVSSVSSFDSSEDARASVSLHQDGSDVLSTTSLVKSDRDVSVLSMRVTAWIRGHDIKKYTPPVLPKIDTNKPRASIFTFLQTGAEGPKPSPKHRALKEGVEVTTPYGPGRVVEYRDKEGFVVVDMAGAWARAYLRESDVKPASKSLLGSLMRQLSMQEKGKPLEFPYAEGTAIVTPFGKGKVSRPLPPPNAPRNQKVRGSRRSSTTIGISLDAWTLADGSHPIVFTAVETAREWKDREHHGEKPSIFSSLGTLVESSKSLFQPFLSPKHVIPEQPVTKFHRYYEDAAAVATSFGRGRVAKFRPEDGIYEVSLDEWSLADGSHPRVYLQKEDISHRVADGCQEGYPVLTSLGVSGTLASVVPTTGVHIVTVPSCGMVCYLQPECVVRPLKAAVGEDVLTAYGEGKVSKYDVSRDMYTITLNWKATLYAKGDTFDRVGDGIQDRDGTFGVKWLLRFLFFSSSSGADAPRSRSNSIVSLSGTSQSNRSVVS